MNGLSDIDMMGTMDKSPADFSQSIQPDIPAQSMNQGLFDLFPGNSQDLLNTNFDPGSVDLQAFNLMGTSYLDNLFDSALGPGSTTNALPTNYVALMSASMPGNGQGTAGEYDLDLPGYVLDDL